MEVNPDFRDLLQVLNDANVKYLVIGAYAVALYSEPRFTKDLDVWVEARPENAKKVWAALAEFGAPLDGVSLDDFSNRDMVYQIGVEPNRIDVIMDLDGVEFAEAWKRRREFDIVGLIIPVIGKSDLIKNKKIVARPQDLLDVQRLEDIK